MAFLLCIWAFLYPSEYSFPLRNKPDKLSGCQRGRWSVGAGGFLHFPNYLIHFFFFNLFIYLWLCWVFVSVRGLSPVAASGGHSSSRCADLSLSQAPLLWSTGCRRAGSAIVAHGPSRSAARGILPDQGSNPCPLHRQADSQPLRHQGSPLIHFLNTMKMGLLI